MPHITLEEGDLSPDMLAKVIRWLGGQTFDWEIRVDNFGLLYGGDGEYHDLALKFTFKG